jgi:hypothetical protein
MLLDGIYRSRCQYTCPRVKLGSGGILQVFTPHVLPTSSRGVKVETSEIKRVETPGGGLWGREH